MKTTSSTPNLAQDLLRIHKVITRGLDTSLIKGKDYLEHGFPQPELTHGFACYTHCLTQVLSSHHNSEDLIAFPAFMKYLPSAPYAQLSADHHAIGSLLIGMPQAIIDLTGESPKRDWR